MNDPENSSLDHLLSQARWPEPGPERLARLLAHWRRITGSGRLKAVSWTRPFIAVMAAAATVLIAVGIVTWSLGTSRNQQAQLERRTVKPADRRRLPTGGPHRLQRPEPLGPSTLAARPLPDALPRARQSSAAASLDSRSDLSRSPTAYEALVVQAAARRQAAARADAPSDEAARAAEKVLDGVVDQVVALIAAGRPESSARDAPEPGALDAEPPKAKSKGMVATGTPGEFHAELTKLADPLWPDRDRHEQRLMHFVAQAGGERQMAAVWLLAEIGSWKSVPMLRDLSRWPAAHAAAVRGLARLDSPSVLSQLIKAETDPPLRRDLLAALAVRNSREAVDRFLSFIRDPTMTEAALAALDTLVAANETLSDPVPQPIVGLYFEALAGPDVERRRAAARVLGRLDGPEITRRLVDLALNSACRQEAMLALVASSGDEAASFVATARQDVYLLASVRVAENQIRRTEVEHYTLKPGRTFP